MTQQKNKTDKKPTRRELTPEQQQRYIIYRSLPFKNRRMTFSQWVEKNSFATIITFLICIFGIVTLASVRFKIEGTQLVDGVLIEIPPVEEPEPIKPPEEKKSEQLEIERMLEVSNAVADANAEKDAGETERSQELLDQAKEIQDKLDANKKAYEDGLKQVESMNSKKAGSKSDKNKNKASRENANDKNKDKRIPAISKKGNVTVEYDLPGRYATYLPVPAYKCQDGGKVVVEITVDKNGDVLEASIKGSTSSKSVCIRETALEYAKSARFDVNSSAQSRQVGTITYIFLSQ